jgi:hypothetical protein
MYADARKASERIAKEEKIGGVAVVVDPAVPFHQELIRWR